MTETIIKSAVELITFVEVDVVGLSGVRFCDVNLVTGVLCISMTAGRRFEVLPWRLPAMTDAASSSAPATPTAAVLLRY